MVCLVVLGEIVVVKCLHPLEVAGIAYVHGVWEGFDGWFGFKFAWVEIFDDRIVGVGGGDELMNRDAHMFGKQSSGEVAEVAGWDTDY